MSLARVNGYVKSAFRCDNDATMEVTVTFCTYNDAAYDQGVRHKGNVTKHLTPDYAVGTVLSVSTVATCLRQGGGVPSFAFCNSRKHESIITKKI